VRAYLAHGANMNATAAAVYAHRHTVASRLERVRGLTGHDPLTPLGQAQLAVGLQALDIQRTAVRNLGLSAG
jgi:sugar diacid utilization regulator